MESIVVSTFLMGLVLVAIAVAAGRSTYFGENAAAEESGADLAVVLSQVARSPRTWVVGFLLLVFGIGGGAILAVSGPDISQAAADTAIYAVGGFAGALLVGYLIWGVFLSAKSKGIGTAGAVALGLWVLGTVVVGAIVAMLVGTY